MLGTGSFARKLIKLFLIEINKMTLDDDVSDALRNLILTKQCALCLLDEVRLLKERVRDQKELVESQMQRCDDLRVYCEGMLDPLPECVFDPIPPPSVGDRIKRLFGCLAPVFGLRT